ncbi:MAG TPA: glycosyltransferase family 39 protein [Verrucomicrobiae bacterium]|jgi:4-amino-4-deoxy-L-arabinose transferase-like glycosyltransferase|nr:glycosyltransferase family 39 protein [Verrucomicrobiae bacterium]
MSSDTRILPQIAVVAAACAFLFFFGLGAFGLVGADEPRYAQIAREMFTRHDWIVPTLNGTPWLEKPALLYWKVMSSYAIFGVHDWAARIPAACYATALVFAVFFFIRRFRPGSELDAALITASCAAIIGFARGASTDMLISAPFCMAMLSWWTWHETGKKVWLAAFYALLAVGALAKGPVAPALALLVVCAYALVRRNAKILLRSIWWAGFLLFFAIVLPWYIAVQIKVPQFLHFFFFEQNLQRFGTNRYQHSQPFWYYLVVFLLATLPWTVFVLSAIVDAARSGIKKMRERADEPSTSWLPLFLVVWIVIPILFFSISRSKLPGYILPAIPAAALLAAEWLHRSDNALSRLRLLLHAAICGLLLAGALLAPTVIQKLRPTALAYGEVLAAAAVIAIAVLLLVGRGGLNVLRAATLLPIVLAMGFLLRPAANVLDQVISARAVDARLSELHAPQAPIAVYDVKRDVEFGLNFYRNAPIARYEHGDGRGNIEIVVPAGQHVLIAREGSINVIQAAVGQRQVLKLGGFAPQHLEFYLISSAR